MSKQQRLLSHLLISGFILVTRYLQVGHLTVGTGVIAGCLAYVATSLISEWMDRRQRKESEA